MELRIFAMGGHEDGVIAFESTADEAGSVLMQALAHGYTCENNHR
jgi:hypothetical protein